jgi:pullulanase/glycogen debranching enzyme
MPGKVNDRRGSGALATVVGFCALTPASFTPFNYRSAQHTSALLNMKITRRSALLSLLASGLSLVAASLHSEDLSKQVARPVPTWLRDGVIYEVFPRNFSREGNFNGITARLDELKDVGVNILWLMPIHPIGEKMRKGTIGSPYAVKDYYAINSDYGTAGDLKRLVSEAHKRDLKVILDIVANHTAWDSVMMQHPEFYKQDANGKILPPVAGVDGCGRAEL